MKDRKIRIRLNWTIILLALLAGVLPVLLAGMITSQISKNHIQDEVLTLAREFVEQQYIKMIQIQKQMEGVLVSLEDNPEIIEYLESSQNEPLISGETFQTRLQSILSRQTMNLWIDSMEVVRMDGSVITSRKSISPEALSTEKIDLFLEKTGSNPKGIFYEGIRQTGRSTSPEMPVLSIVKRVNPHGIYDLAADPIGFVIINLSTNSIYKDLELYRFGNGSNLHIYDTNGTIIFTYDKSSIGEKLSTNITGELSNTFGTIARNVDKVPMQLIYYRIALSDWTILLTVPISAIQGKTSGITLITLVVLLVSLIISAIMMTGASVMIIRPINQLAVSLREIRQGKFKLIKRLNGSAITELDELIHWFNIFVENQVTQQTIKDQLHDSEARYRTLFENSPVALWDEDFSHVVAGLEEIGLQGEALRKYLDTHPEEVIDLMSRIVIYDLNQSTMQLYGFEDKNELLKNTARLFQHVSDAALVDELMAMSTRQLDYETTVDNSRADGKIIKVKVRWSVYPGHEEKMSRVIVNTVDITQQIQAGKVQAAIYRISQAATSTENLQELYQSIHSILGELMPAKNLYIALYDGERGIINFPYFVDEYDPPPGWRKFGNGWTEYVIKTGEPMLLSPTNLQQMEEEVGIKTVGADSIDWLGVPLKVEDRVIGVVTVQTYTEGIRYTEVEKGILVFVSNQIAMAIERKRAEEQLKYSSTHDPLTGLYNRRYYEEEIKRHSSGRQSPIGAIIMDIDGLKQVNDQMGHATGDDLLKAFATVIQKEFRTSDVVARLGGDEFGVILPLSSINVVKKAVERIQKSVERYNTNNDIFVMSFSVGYSTTENGGTLIETINAADGLMYIDKAAKSPPK